MATSSIKGIQNLIVFCFNSSSFRHARKHFSHTISTPAKWGFFFRYFWKKKVFFYFFGNCTILPVILESSWSCLTVWMLVWLRILCCCFFFFQLDIIRYNFQILFYGTVIKNKTTCTFWNTKKLLLYNLFYVIFGTVQYSPIIQQNVKWPWWYGEGPTQFT